MRLYLLGIAAAALVLLSSFVLREKNRAELQLQQQNDALAAAAQSVDAELSGCCSTIAQFITNPDPKKYASATERDLQAEVELTYYIYLSTENNPDLVNYYLYYPDANVILSAHSAARAAQNSSFYAAVQAYTSQETAIYTLDVDGRIGFLFPFDSHFYIAYERMRSAPALVFAELDLNTIFSVLPESLQSGRNALYIMDPAGAVIYENTSNRLQTLLSDGTQRSVLSGQGQHICQSVSSLTGWTFYHTTPAATGMQIFCNALVASLPFLLCLLGLAILVYLFFKRQVIQPLQGILQQTPVELPQQTENELALLCHAREQLVQQTNSHASMLARMRPEILNQTFSRLLHGDAFDPTETQALLSDLGFQYQFNDRIVVLLLRLPEQQELRNELTTLLPRFVQKIGWDDARTHLLADVPVCSCICYSLLDLHSVDDYLTEQLSRVPQQSYPPTDASAPYLPAEKKTQAHLKAVAEQIRSGKLTLAQETVLQFLQERLSEDPGLYRNDLIAAWIHQLFLVFSVSEAEAAGIELAQRLGTAEPIPDADCRELLGQVIQLCSGCYLKSQNKYILAAKKLVQEQYSDPTLSLASVAEALGIHPNCLSKLFKTSINLNFIDYLRSCRVQRSRELPERGLSVNAVAEQTGFSSPQSFIRVFKASVGCTPGQYRKQNK